jgi:hypothetical protein
MTVAHVDKQTNRATDWPPERMSMFYEQEATLTDGDHEVG